MRARTALTILALLPLAPTGCDGQRDAGPPAVRIGRGTWQVELATDPDARYRGLSGRKQVPAGTGMLFVFPDERVRYFEMRHCHVPLDIAFLSARLTVLKTQTMPVEPDPSHPQRSYSSKWPAQYVLEVPAGELEGHGVAAGDPAELLGNARNAVKEAR